MKKSLLVLSIGFALTAMAGGSAAMAKPMDKKPQQKAEKKAEKQYDKRVESKKQEKQRDKGKPSTQRHFSHDDQRVIRDYYKRHRYEQPGGPPKSLPPGLQKKYERTGELPPGWQKKVYRGETLPYDVYRYGREVPYDLRRQLPTGPVGSKILEVEGKIIRVMEGSRMILDVFDL